jgi:hypothetical protein
MVRKEDDHDRDQTEALKQHRAHPHGTSARNADIIT